MPDPDGHPAALTSSARTEVLAAPAAEPVETAAVLEVAGIVMKKAVLAKVQKVPAESANSAAPAMPLTPALLADRRRHCNCSTNRQT
jgi:hypothetical protein